MSNYNLIDVKNLTINDQMLSIGEENPFLTKSDEITKILSSSVVTKIEVFPTNIDIPEGTTDSFNELKNIFEWDENDSSYRSQVFTEYKYINSVPSCDTLYLQMYLYPKTKQKAEMIIDWGDGTSQIIADWNPDSFKYEYYKDWESSGWPYSEMMISHQYEGSYVNRKNIVSIYGKDFFMVRGLYSSTISNIKDVTGQQYYNIISRVFERDLPVHTYLKNVSSIANGSLRILRVLTPYEYPQFMTNVSNAFTNCYNLQYVDMDESGFENRSIYSCGSMFAGCTSLEYSNFVIPSFVASGGANSIYKGCINLSVDIASLLPKCGFIGSRYSLANAFSQCSSLYGEVPGYMHDVHSYEMFSSSIGTLTAALPTDLSPLKCKSWMCLPTIVDMVPSFSDVIGQTATAVTSLPSTAATGTLFYLSKSYTYKPTQTTFPNYSIVKKTDDGYELVGSRFRNIYFLSADASIDLSGTGELTELNAGEILYIDSKTNSGSGPFYWKTFPSDQRAIYLNANWISPNGKEYKSACLYTIGLVDGTYDYILEQDLSSKKGPFILRYYDSTVNGYPGEMWSLATEPSLHYTLKNKHVIGNTLTDCSESLRSTAPYYLGGTMENPSYRRENPLFGQTIDLSSLSQVDVISALIESMGGHAITS